MSESEDNKYLRPPGDTKMKDAWDSLNGDSPKGKLLEQLNRLPLDGELGKIVKEGYMNVSDGEALRVANSLKEAFDSLAKIPKSSVMTREEIRKRCEDIQIRRRNLNNERERLLLEWRQLQLECDHKDKYQTSVMGESTTRCPDCGYST